MLMWTVCSFDCTQKADNYAHALSLAPYLYQLQGKGKSAVRVEIKDDDGRVVARYGPTGLEEAA